MTDFNLRVFQNQVAEKLSIQSKSEDVETLERHARNFATDLLVCLYEELTKKGARNLYVTPKSSDKMPCKLYLEKNGAGRHEILEINETVSLYKKNSFSLDDVYFSVKSRTSPDEWSLRKSINYISLPSYLLTLVASKSFVDSIFKRSDALNQSNS